MPVRWLPVVSLLVLCSARRRAHSGRRPSRGPVAGPAVILRFRSVDSLQTDMKWVIKLVGEEEAAKQVDGCSRCTSKVPASIPRRRGAPTARSARRASTAPPFSSSPSATRRRSEKARRLRPERQGPKGRASTPSSPSSTSKTPTCGSPTATPTSATTSRRRRCQELLAPGLVFDPKDTAAMSVVLRVGQVPKNLKDTFLDGFKQGIEQAKRRKGPTRPRRRRSSRTPSSTA